AMLRRLPVQTSEQPTSVAGAGQGEQAARAAAGADAVPALHTAATAQSPVPTAVIAVPASTAQANEAVDQALAALHPLIDWFVQELPTAPMLFRLNRISAWTTLDQLPQTHGRTTRLPP